MTNINSYDCMAELSEAIEEGIINKDNLWIGRGFTVWGPGELEAQLNEGLWFPRLASSKVLLGCASDMNVIWRKVYNLSKTRQNRHDLYE